MLILFSDTTIIQRKKTITHVSISDAEIELLLKGYQLHPCSFKLCDRKMWKFTRWSSQIL